MDFKRCPVCLFQNEIFITDATSSTIVQFAGIRFGLLTELNIIVSSCHLPTLSQASFSSWKSHAPLPEVLRNWACNMIFNSRAGLVLQGVHTFLFSLSSFWPRADRFTSGGTPASERGKKASIVQTGALVERKQGLFFFLMKITRR